MVAFSIENKQKIKVLSEFAKRAGNAGDAAKADGDAVRHNLVRHGHTKELHNLEKLDENGKAAGGAVQPETIGIEVSEPPTPTEKAKNRQSRLSKKPDLTTEEKTAG